MVNLDVPFVYIPANNWILIHEFIYPIFLPERDHNSVVAAVEEAEEYDCAVDGVMKNLHLLSRVPRSINRHLMYCGRLLSCDLGFSFIHSLSC